MNNQNLQIIFKNYIDRFDMMNDPEHDETYKWEAIRHFQDHWDIEAEDFGAMFKNAVKATYNLINNSIIQPTNGIVEIAKFEPDKIRALFRDLYADDQGDLIARQDRIDTFVSSANLLLEKYASGKWKFAQDTRSAIFYLNLMFPDENFIYKASQASTFARCVEYGNEIGGGQSFRLNHYYYLCEWLAEELQKAPDILDVHRKRFTRNIWPDKNLHILAYDVIYCAVSYDLYQNTVIKPRDKKSLIEHEKQKQNDFIQQQLFELQTKQDDVQEQLAQYGQLSFVKMNVQHKRFGEGKVLAQNGNILTVNFSGTEKNLVLPEAIVSKMLVTENLDLLVAAS